MRHDRLLIGLLLVASALVDWVAVLVASAVARQPAGQEDLAVAVVESLAFAQVNIVAIWAGLGKKSTPWRLTGLFLVAVLWSVWLKRAVAPPDDITPVAFVAALLLGQAFFVFGPLSIAAVLGVRLTAEVPVATPEGEVAGLRPLQFSLRHLFAWTTATAVVLGVSQYVIRSESVPIPWPELLWPDVLFAIAAWGAGNATIAFLTFWAALSNRSLPARMIPLLAVTGGLAVIVQVAASGVWAAKLTLLLVSQTVVLLASLWVFRVAGYRLRWTSRYYPGKQEAHSDST